MSEFVMRDESEAAFFYVVACGAEFHATPEPLPHAEGGRGSGMRALLPS